MHVLTFFYFCCPLETGLSHDPNTEANLTVTGAVLIPLYRAIYYIQPVCLHARRSTVCSHFRATDLCLLTAVMVYTKSVFLPV